MRTDFGSVTTWQLSHREKIDPSWNMSKLIDGVVLNIIYPEDSENISGVIECNVLLRDYSGLAKHAKILRHGSNTEEADEWIPRPSNEDKVKRVFKGELFSPLDLGGELVLVAFILGRADYPIVLGSLEHRNSNLFTRKKPEKRRRYLRWGKTEVQIDGDGNVVVNVLDGKKITLKSSDKEIAVFQNGEIRLDPNATGITATSGIITGESIDPFTGQPHIDFSSVVKGAKL